MSVMVSCVMPFSRPQFLSMALRCFARQTWADRELILVKDAIDPPPMLPMGVNLLHLDQKATIGQKLNAGIEVARGTIIQKLDDDDWYSPEFLEVMLSGVAADPLAIGALSDFCVLNLSDKVLRYAGQGWAAGGTMMFHKALWDRAPFSERPDAVADYQFFADHPRAHRPIMIGAEHYILVRHSLGHRWENVRGMDGPRFFQSLPKYRKPLHAVIPPEDVKFYQELKV